MKIFNRFIVAVAAVLLIVCCSADNNPAFVPGSSQIPTEDDTTAGGNEENQNPEDGSQEGTVTPDMPNLTPIPSGGTPDYSKLTSSNHPRIIFTQSDFDGIKAALPTATGPFKTIHEKVITVAGSSVGQADLTHTLTGKRMLDISRKALQRILSCAYAYKTTGESKYLTQAEHDIQTVCQFTDWNAARHWLDVGEMATAVGLGYDWLYNDLSSSTKTLARNAIKNFCFTPANNGTWNLNFYASDGNWNQVCNGGIIAAALAIYENESSCKTMIEKSISSNATAVASMYSPDGNYPEGYSYWNYGTIYQALINTMLYTATGSDAGLTQKEGFSKTGKYMVFMEGPTKKCFNYSDCAEGTSACLAQWYFAWKYADLSHLYLEKDRMGSYGSASEVRLLPMVAYYAYKMGIESIESIPAPTENVWKGAGTTPVLLAHSNWKMDATDKFLGIKGGKANTSHAHMDAGSFVYDYNGVRWSADLGLQSYGTLESYINLWSMVDGSERWTVFRYKNTSHSTITINDTPHKVSGSATIKSAINYNGRLGGVVDMTPAVSSEAASVVRTIYMEGDDLYVTDEITALSSKAAKVRWTMVTHAVPTIEYGNITLESAGKYLYMKKSSSTNHNVSWKTWSTVGSMSYDASNAGMYMCGYEVTVAAGTSASITIRLTPNE